MRCRLLSVVVVVPEGDGDKTWGVGVELSLTILTVLL